MLYTFQHQPLSNTTQMDRLTFCAWKITSLVFVITNVSLSIEVHCHGSYHRHMPMLPGSVSLKAQGDLGTDYGWMWGSCNFVLLHETEFIDSRTYVCILMFMIGHKASLPIFKEKEQLDAIPALKPTLHVVKVHRSDPHKA